MGLLHLIRRVMIVGFFVFVYKQAGAIEEPGERLTVYNTNLSITIDALKIKGAASNANSCIIPFTLAGKLIVVQGRADTVQGNFILDTGAPDLVLNNTYFRNYIVSTSNTEQEASITGIGEQSKRITVKQFQLGTLSYSKTYADVLSLGHLEDARGLKILGLLGISLFKDCELMIDFENRQIHLYRISKKEKETYIHPLLATHPRVSVMPFELRENRILVDTKIGNKELQFVIDYAAESNVIDSRLPEKVLDSVRVTGRVLLTGTGSKKIEAATGDLSAITIGPMQFKKLPVIITNLENTCFGTLNCINGVLGHDFLSGYTLVFNFVTRKLYILY
ncbi:aspartyl protease family protein [Pollutibacter soli]|uniref:aspartyl protease family protein n=1 Tax=Pollutibacter soli TaxID=3034157 RepID=UPI0030139AC4